MKDFLVIIGFTMHEKLLFSCVMILLKLHLKIDVKKLKEKETKY